MRATLPLLLLTFTVACGHATPTQPTTPPPLRLALAGQSNAMLLRPFLQERVEVPVFYGEVTTIAPCWSLSGSCWGIVKPELGEAVDAFVWSQGESDVLADTPVDVYAQRQTELVARVRAAARNPRLLVIVLQMGPFFDNGRGGELGQAYQQFKRAWASADVNAAWIETDDLEFRADQVHMTDDGYRAVTTRIVAAVEARR